MKMKKRVTALLIGASMLLQSFGSMAEENGWQQTAHGISLPQPVFELNFENLEQAAGEKVTGTFLAASGQEVTAHNQVTVMEGNGGGKAVLLDNVQGNQGHLTTPNNQELNPESLTASVWLKRVSPISGDGRILWNKQSAKWDSPGWFMGWTIQEVMAMVTDGDNVGARGGNPNDAMKEGEWTNFVSVFDKETGTITVYQDGIEIASKQTDGASITWNEAVGELMIGKSGYGDEGIGCVADDIRIYQEALDAREVGELAGLTDQDYLDADAESLTAATRVSADFTLTTKGRNGSEITWTSNHKAIEIRDGGQAVVTRGKENREVTLTAELRYGELTKTKTFFVTVLKENEPVRGLRKLEHDEIIDLQGTIGTRLREAMSVYGMDYLYGQEMKISLDEYRQHSHGDWSWLRGEQPGKWLESMANCKWMDEDGSIKSAITDVVDQLAATQTKEDRSAAGYNQFGGYLGNATEEIRKSKPVKGMDPYEMYSTLNGLLRVYENYRVEDAGLAEKALECAVDLTDYLTATIGDENTKVPYEDGTLSNMNKVEFWPLAITNGVTIAGHDVHQGWEGTLLIGPVMQLAETIRQEDGERARAYSAWVDWSISNIDKWASIWGGYGDTPFADLDKVASGEMGIDEIQHYVHAHTFQMNFLGFLKKYQETGDDSYLNKVVGAWEDITSRQMYITGTVSVGEHYEAGHNLPNTGSVGETCATNSWTLLNHNLFELTEEAKYQQVVENVIFNHMFATTTMDGDGYSYHRPLNGTTDRFYTGPDCCSSSGMRMQSYIPYYLYSKSDTEVYVNQFIENEVKIRMADGTMHLKQTTDYPESDTIQIRVQPDSAGGILNIRVPDWVEEPSIQINGEEVQSAVRADSYAAVNVSANDVIEITYPSELTWVEGEYSNEDLWAMKKGPMVYCLAAAFMSKEESQTAFGTDIARVTVSSVLKPENKKAVHTEGSIDFADNRILGKGYLVKMNTPRGEQSVTVVPYANIGQWYRIGESRPQNYGSAVRYPYQIWMSAIMEDYPEEPEPETKPVVHYDFDQAEGTVIPDLSGNGKDAVLSGGAEIKTGGRLNQAVILDGKSGFVQLPEDILYGLYRMTLSAWVKPDELGSWARIFDFGSRQDPPYPNLFLTVNSGGNNVRLAYEDGDSSQVNAGAVLKTGQWQHLSVVIDGTKASLYLDGTKLAENAGFYFTPVKTGNMVSNLLGKSNYKSDQYYKGGMDDFRIYNRALSSKEILALSRGEEPVRVIQSVGDFAAVETIAGTAPVLPQKASVSYDDGTNGREPVIWEKIPEEQYAAAGTFEVKGKVGSFEVTIIVHVKENGEKPEKTIVSAVQPSPVETFEGTAPRLPASVKVIYSDGSEGLQPVLWEHIAEKAYAKAGSFTVKGTVGKLQVEITVVVKGKESQKPGSGEEGITAEKPVIRLNYKKLPLQVKKSTNVIRIKSSSVKDEKIRKAESSNKKVATVKVKNGRLTVKGHRKGMAVITVTSTNGGTDRIKITVKKKVPVSKLTMSKKKATLKKGKKLRLSVIKKPVTAVNAIRWKSSDSRIASVNSRGLVKAKKRGKVTISAVSSNGKRAVCSLKIR